MEGRYSDGHLPSGGAAGGSYGSVQQGAVPFCQALFLTVAPPGGALNEGLTTMARLAAPIKRHRRLFADFRL